MTASNEADFEFYYKRLAEFDSLLPKANSKTLQNLLQVARDSTESSLEKFAKLQHMTLVILAAKKITTEKQFEQYTVEVKRASEAFHAGKFASVEQYSNLVDGIMALGNRDKSLYELSLQVHTLAVSEFQKFLLQKIYKPNNSSFHYESILEGLQYLAGKIFPGLDELNAIKRVVPSVRKKEFAKTGDKLLLYIEQYADVLEKWNDLADAYINILEE